MLVGLSGRGHAGKDEVGKIFVERYHCRRFALATKMKEAALALDPIIDYRLHVEGGGGHYVPVRLSELIALAGPEEAKEHPEVRRLYQRMGTEVGRKTIDEDLWVRLLFQLAGRHKNVVITDVRFLNELLAIQKRGGVVFRVVRPGDGGLAGEAGRHVSELELDDDLDIYDAYIHNDAALEDLPGKVAQALASIGGR